MDFARFIASLSEKRRKMALELVDKKVDYETYLTVYARCAEINEVIDQARHIAKGEDE